MRSKINKGLTFLAILILAAAVSLDICVYAAEDDTVNEVIFDIDLGGDEMADDGMESGNGEDGAEIVIDDFDDAEMATDEAGSPDRVIAHNNGIVFEEALALGGAETKLGNLVSDAYRYAANRSDTASDGRFDAALIVSGIIKGSIANGNITVADAKDILVYGNEADGQAGYPLVSVYFTGRDIKKIAELDASVFAKYDAAAIFMSGVAFSYNVKRPPFDKVSGVWFTPAMLEDSTSEIDNDKLYRVVTDSFSFDVIQEMAGKSRGILNIIPKDENGNNADDISSMAVHTKDGGVLTADRAVSDYLKSFSQNDSGISEIPKYYDTFHDRKVVENTFSPTVYFKNTSSFFYISAVCIIAAVIVIVFAVRAVIRHIYKKKIFVE